MKKKIVLSLAVFLSFILVLTSLCLSFNKIKAEEENKMYISTYETPGLAGMGKLMTGRYLGSNILYQKVDGIYYVYFSYDKNEIDNVFMKVKGVDRKYYYSYSSKDLISNSKNQKTIIMSLDEKELDSDLEFSGIVNKMNKQVNITIRHNKLDVSDKKGYDQLPIGFRVNFYQNKDMINEDKTQVFENLSDVKFNNFFDSVEKISLNNETTDITNEIKYLVVEKDKDKNVIKEKTYNTFEEIKPENLDSNVAYIEVVAFYKDNKISKNNLTNFLVVKSNGGLASSVEKMDKSIESMELISTVKIKTKPKELYIIPPIVLVILIAYSIYAIKVTKNNKKRK